MKKYFKYIDGTTEEITEVLAGNSEKAFLYAPISYYKAIARERIYDGTPHVTQLLNGERMELLRHIVDCAVDVDGSVWTITGLTGHRNLEESSGEEEAGKTWKAFGIQGTCDHIEPLNGELCIIDSKFYGSYAVASKLGVYEAGRIPLIGADGKPEVYQKAGKWGKVGDPKTVPQYKYNIEKGESFDLVMQLNIYKLIAEENGVFPIGLKAFIVPRDGGTMVAKNRGIERNTYLITIPVRDKALVFDFIDTRRDAINEAMKLIPAFEPLKERTPEAVVRFARENNIDFPRPCSERECWKGRRCQGYCEVSEVCRHIGDVGYLTSISDKKDLEDF